MATDNELLGQIQDYLEDILASLLQSYSSLANGDTEQTVDDGDSTPYTRTANANARGIVVCNSGDSNDAYVFEGGHLIGIVPPGESWRSPTDGTGIITVQTKPSSNLSTTIYLTTLIR